MHLSEFKNRAEAGIHLAQALKKFARKPDIIILALPRGGVPVGFEVAKKLKVPLDILLVRKLGAPGHEEMAVGAIAPDDHRVLNPDVVDIMGVSREEIRRIEEKELRELHRRMAAYRGNRPPPDLAGKTVILIDDGLATGATMQVAVDAVRDSGPKEIVVAVPTGAIDAVERLEQSVDEVICLLQPRQFFGVGAWYEDFRQVPDKDVQRILAEADDLGLSIDSNRKN